jgi:hypothetical protein
MSSSLNNGVLNGLRQIGLRPVAGPTGNLTLTPPGGYPGNGQALANPVYVDSFGARGNGLTDDTAAILAAMNALGPKGIPVGFAPGKAYVISEPLLWQPSAGGLTGQAFNAPPLIGGGQGASAARFGSYKQGITQLIASPSFPSGQFMIDYIGDTGSNNCIAGYEISGLSLQCNSRAAGIRNCNAHTSTVRRLTINQAVTPNPSNTVGNPSGAMNAVASPSTNAYNNRYEDILVYSPGQDGFAFSEGSGSYVMASNCVVGSAGRYGHVAGDGAVLTACASQGAASADFVVYYTTLIGCNNIPWNGGCAGNALLIYGNGTSRQSVILGGQFSGNNNSGHTDANAAMIQLAGSNAINAIIQGTNFKTGSHTSYWLYAGTSVTGNIAILGCNFGTFGTALTTGAYDILSTLSDTFQLIIRDCLGLNPFGSQTVSVPSSGTAAAALPFDAVYYVTAASGGSVAIAISGGPTVTIPASALCPVFIPAGQAPTPTYGAGNAPAWVVEGN